jgi:Cation efflux family
VRRLQVVLLLNLGLITALAIVGLTAHSLAVLAAGADYLADAGGIGVALLAIWLASQPPSRRRPGRLSQRDQHRRAGQHRLAAGAEHRDRGGSELAAGRRGPPG